jgi:RNA methyltransferase, TrmH family
MTTVEMISKNTISLIRSLGQKKFRHLNMLFIAEGKKIIVETLREKKYSVHKLFLTENALRELQPMFQNTIDAQIISDEELRKISFLTEPDFGLAILECKETPNQISIKGEKLTLVLDGIRDPGNLGTIVRIADWFGIRNIVCSEDTTDFYSPKVVQSSMGSFNRVNLFYTELKRFMSESNEEAQHIWGIA